MLEKFTLATDFTIGFFDHPDMNLLITIGHTDEEIFKRARRLAPRSFIIKLMTSMS